MMTKIPKGGASRAGSCGGLVAYLEKEQAGQWISQAQDNLTAPEVIAAIDANKRDLSKSDDKYYQVVISPSGKEMAHIGHDPEKLTAFVRAAMEQYAANFGKGLGSVDLVWFAKVEHSRSHTHQERAVQLGEIAKGTPKEGDQTHVHVLVSRLENLQGYKAKQQAGELPLTAQGKPRRAYKLSPLTHHQETGQGAVLGGFGRNRLSSAVERQFDQQFGYQRPLTESFRYLHTMKHGSEQAKEEITREVAFLRPAFQVHRSDISHEKPEEYKPIVKPAKAPQVDSNEAVGDLLGKMYQQKDALDLNKAIAAALAERDKAGSQTKKVEP
jgi:hypothetical protein